MPFGVVSRVDRGTGVLDGVEIVEGTGKFGGKWPEVLYFTADVSFFFFFFFRQRISEMALPTGNLFSSQGRI